MAFVKISELPAASSAAGTDELEANQAGTSRKVTAAQLRAGLASSGANSDITALSGLTTALSVAQGGTGATTASGARTSLGLGTAATAASTDFAAAAHVGSGGSAHAAATTSVAGFMSASDKTKLDGVAVGATANTGTVTSVGVSGGTTGLTTSGGPVTTSGTITLGGTLAVANGGTGASTAADARTNLGLAIGTNVQAYDAELAAIAALTANGLIARTSASTAASRTLTAGSNRVTISNGDGVSGNPTIDVSEANLSLPSLGGTLSIAKGGTGATDAATARANLGLAIGTNVQAYDADLAVIAGLTGTSGLLRKTAADTWSLDTSSFLTGNQTISLSGDLTGSGSTAITTTLANSGVSAGTYTNATVTVDAKGRVTSASSGSAGGVTSFSAGATGLTPSTGTTGAVTLAGTLAVANGGTGATVAATARTNLGLGTAATMTGPTGTIVGTTDAQTLTAKTLGNYTEAVFAITDGTTVNLDPNNGSIQTWTLGANRTPGQANWAAGQSITLLVDDGSAATITWTTLAVVWKTDGGSAPTLQTTGFTVIVLWKVGTTIYGARVGDA